jgi:glycine dehydrogenase
MSTTVEASLLAPTDDFVHRHLGPSDADVAVMLAALGVASIEQLIDQTIPAGIRLKSPLKLDASRGEFEAAAELRALARKNRVNRSLIGAGYYGCITPPVIQRNILENPGWYTQYTPYQAEISQGRLEALINFQTMVADLTGLPLANASLLDEATAAAEAMHMCASLCSSERSVFFVADDCHPQTLAVVQARAKPLKIRILTGDPHSVDFSRMEAFGILLQYPNTRGDIRDYAAVVEKAHAAGALVAVATDLLALTLLKPPGEFGADIAVGSSQRFGVPLGFGGPHAAFIATRADFARQLPGRLIGVSKDVHGAPAYRLSIQTREQHIRREKATSNICTAQVLLAVMAGMYAVYHGPDGLRRIARRVHGMTMALAAALKAEKLDVVQSPRFDTLVVRFGGSAERVLKHAAAHGFNLRPLGSTEIGISLDELTTIDELSELVHVLADGGGDHDWAKLAQQSGLPPALARTSPFLTHPVFHRYRCEHEMLRYMKRLEARDLSLTTSMIPLGSCTMKLNAAAEMLPISWPEFAGLHPYAPAEQTAGYREMFRQLEAWLAEITGLPAVSLQPNSGAQGEYAGLLAIRAHHDARNHADRDVCLIPVSAHGTNPASAVMAGFRVVAVKCDIAGNVDLADLRERAREHAENLGALMITYPSTHGVFEEDIREICRVVHDHGGQVYMDGANMNAQVGLCRPGDIGADVCHLNLHKTFCIPHGGGGPGMGPIAVAAHLAAHLPGNPCEQTSGVGPVSAAAWGSAGILPIPWMYIRMMGGDGLRRATQVAILSANYMAARLAEHYPVLYRGKNGRIAHEFILDCRAFEAQAGVRVEDIAKRLMDYGFHAPTMSFPVPGTLMIEPTESESRAELDRLCDALIAIRGEIRDIAEGRADRSDNSLKHAPHTAAVVCASEWTHRYSREQAAFPAGWLREHKYWPPVGRVDNVWGDRNLFCTCVPMTEISR